MNNIKSEMVYADRIIKDCIKKNDKFKDRYEAQFAGMSAFIEKAGYEEKLKVDPLILGYALVDYFEDIQRLKALHPIDHINSIKICAYTSYWLLFRKPIQTCESGRDLIYANEKYVFSYIMDFLSMNEAEQKRLNLGDLYLNERRGVESFREMLFYYLKFRLRDATSLELMLVSFFAGQVYQDQNEDLSNIVSSKYAPLNI